MCFKQTYNRFIFIYSTLQLWKRGKRILNVWRQSPQSPYLSTLPLLASNYPPFLCTVYNATSLMLDSTIISTRIKLFHFLFSSSPTQKTSIFSLARGCREQILKFLFIFTQFVDYNKVAPPPSWAISELNV